MNDDKEHHPTTFPYLGPPKKENSNRQSRNQNGTNSQNPPNQEDTLDDLDNTILSDDEGPASSRLADEWQAGVDSLFYPKGSVRSFADKPGITSSIALDPSMDITADFPTSSNPFEKREVTALVTIAGSTSTSPATLRWLAKNGDPEVRKAIAQNSATTLDILK